MKLLYVEDNPLDADLTRRVLTKNLPDIGLNIASTVKEALAHLELEDKVPFDILLLDVSLPDGDGLEILCHARAKGISAAAALLTGSGDEKTVIQALKLGAADYVVKRADYLDRLPQTLERVLNYNRKKSLRQNVPLSVLYAEQNTGDVDLTERFFRRNAKHIRIKSVLGGKALLAEFKQGSATKYDVMLLDYRLAGMDALELIKELREIYFCDLPIVLVTGRGSEDVAAQALRFGVSDYVIKDPGYLDRLPTILEHAYAQAELVRERSRLEYLATYDGLTGLLNRSQFCHRANRVFTRAKQQQSHCAVLIIDLDNFKYVNDSFGHPIGDNLLRLFATRLLACIREEDICGRFGGDEFLVLLDQIIDVDHAARITNRIAEIMTSGFPVQGQQVVLSASIGISIYPDDGANIDVLIRNADTAMYQAKSSGRNQHRFFTESMNKEVEQRFKLESDLRKALEREEFFLVFQPQFDINTLRLVGLEALLRWNHPERGTIEPNEFIPTAEQCGLILPIGEWVLRNAFHHLQQWIQLGAPPKKVAINISAKQFRSVNFISGLLNILNQYGLSFDMIELELTESAMAEDMDNAVEILNELKKVGANIAIDDFGTGYSSLAYLKRFPISTLKIDHSFVQDVNSNPEDAAIATAIINLGHTLGMVVVAEGVKTNEQLEFLKEKSCDHAQGFLLSRPISKDEVAELLARI